MDITTHSIKSWFKGLLFGLVILYALATVIWAWRQNNIVIFLSSLLQLTGCLLLLLLLRHSAVIKSLRKLIVGLKNTNLENFNSNSVLLPLATSVDSNEIKQLMEFFQLFLQKLHLSQHRLTEVINAMPSVIIGVTADGLITAWNTQAEAVTQIPASAALGKKLAKIYPAYEGYLQLAKTAILKNCLQKHSKYAKETNAETKYFDIVAYPLTDNNTSSAVIRIDEVTAQVLLEDILLHTEKMHSIGGLAAGVAHEINNPLGAIMQGGQNVMRRLDPSLEKNIELAKQLGVDINAVHKYVASANILEFIQGIRSSGQRAANIVNNLLQFSRANKASKAMHSIQVIIDNAIELASTDYNLQKKIDFRHIKIIKDYQPNLPSVYCCAMEIEQVMLNLLKNAAYALQINTKNPAIDIKLSSEREAVIIEVKDNGPGIKEEVKKKIFDPFFTTKPLGEGTGLGLSVSFNIIAERHGGAFTVESTEGVGTTFIIVLPVISATTGELQDYIKEKSSAAQFV